MTVATTIKRRRHCARWILGAACYLCLPFTLVQSVAPTKRYMRSPRMMIVATASIVPQRQRLVLAGTEDQPNRSVCLCVFFCLFVAFGRSHCPSENGFKIYMWWWRFEDK